VGSRAHGILVWFDGAPHSSGSVTVDSGRSDLQLRLHAKPCILVNTLRYWDGLLAFLDTTVAAGFLKPENRALLMVAANAEEAVMRVREQGS